MDSKDYKYEKVKKKDDEKNENLSVSYFQLYKFSTNIDKLLLGVAVLLSVACGFSEAFFYVILGRYVGTIANFGNELVNAVNETEKLEVTDIFQHKTNEFAIINVVVSITVFASTYISTALFNYTAMRQVFKIRELYFSQVLNQDISWHDQISTGDFASRIVDDLQKIQDGINDKAALACIQTAIVVTTIAQSFVIGWKLALACLVLLPISFLTIHFIGKLSSKLSKEESEANGEAGKVADETLTYIKTVVAFNGQSEEMKRYDRLLLFAMTNNIKRYFFTGLTTGVAYCSAFFGMAVGLWYGVRLMMQGREGDGQDYSIEKIVTVYNSIMVATFYIGGLSPFFVTMNTATGAASKIFGIIKSQPFINKSYSTGTKLNEFKGNISFKNVAFSYPGRPEVEILKNFSLEIKSGETVALVGGSGCGKSTIIQLIQRFYDADHGQICLDGNEIKDLNLKTVRDYIGMVGQEPVLFDGTIAENIKLGRLSATQADIEEAAKKSNAHSFIASFPQGYQTVAGERGAQLSGGQKQRIAIARALIRQPAILLLDEATSALDSRSESIVQETLDEVSKGCTTIIVAHRLSTIRQANRIVVLENGRIIEEGSHDELMLLKGAYHNLVVTQLSTDGGDYSKGSEEITEAKEEQPQEDITTAKEVQTKKKVDYKLATAWEILKTNLFPRWCIVIAIICSIGHVVSTTGCGLCIGKGLAAMAAVDANYVISQVNLYSGIIVGLGLILSTCNICQSYFIGVAGENLTKNLRSSMFNVMISKDMEWFDRSENGVGSLGARLAGEPSSVQNAVCVYSATFINVIIAAIALVIVGIHLSWKLLLCALCFIPLLILLLYLENKLLIEENRKGMEVMEQSAKLAVEAINNIRTVASLAIERAFHNLFTLKLKSYKSVTVRNFHIKGIVYGVSRCTFPLSYIITMYYGAYLIKNREADAATVIAMTEMFISFVWYINNCLVNFSNITKGFVACNQIHELIDPTQERKGHLESHVEVALVINEDIHYRDLSFSYPTRPDIKILDGFDLSVAKGTKVALVGPSGCGKSTVIQLLERFYDADSGHIKFGDQDIYAANLHDHRLRLGMVMQEPNLFSRTIAENIAYGNLGVKIPHAAIIEASQKANIHNFIISLPLGYDTVLGDRGTQLSGGQKQRIAIARALVRNPEVLLLDEATSALDAESEKIVQEALKQANEERTCIVIAHRLETVVDSNLIVVLNKGKVAEKGTHQELMNLQGLYWNLYNLQQQS